MLFVIDLATRRVEIAGIVSEPDSAWVVQCGRQIPMQSMDACVGSASCCAIGIRSSRTRFVRPWRLRAFRRSVLPPRSPNLNAYAERFVRKIKESCLDRLILFSEGSLRHMISEFVAHYHHERTHQGVVISCSSQDRRRCDATHPIVCRPRLGGLLKYYHRPAA